MKLMGSTAFLSNKKVDKSSLQYSIERAEENIHEADLEDFARHALDKKDYKLAIRLYFLQILKHLSSNNFIKWKRDKTNKEYVREMSGNNLFREFRTISRLFERVWYSDVEVKEHQFNLIRPRFLDFLIDSVFEFSILDLTKCTIWLCSLILATDLISAARIAKSFP